MSRALVGIAITVQMATAVATAAPKDWQFEVGATAEESRANWNRVTAGEELARGKAVEFTPAPNYDLTNDDNDAYDLTDGTLSQRMDDRVWFMKDAVGWHFDSGMQNAGSVLFRIDLGAEQPIGQIAIRLMGGREQITLSLPNAIEFLASNDGKNYFRLQQMTKLLPAERELSDFKTGYLVPEEGKAYMHPFFCRVPVRARYIAIRITPEADVYTDQISVTKADGKTPLQELNSFPPVRVFTDGFAVRPKLDSFVVTTNAITPNWILLQSFGNEDTKTTDYSFRLQVPRGLRLMPQSKPAFTEIAATAGARRYEFKGLRLSDGKTPLFFETVSGETVAAGAKAKFTGVVNGKESLTLDYPVQLVAIPKVPKTITDTFKISLGWITNEEQREWPGYLKNLRDMGFGEVPAHTMYWGANEAVLSTDGRRQLEFLQQARGAGYGVVLEESPFHAMLNVVRREQNAGTINEEEAGHIYTQPEGKTGKTLNPLYRGKYYQDELKRVAAMTALVNPDQLHLDIELWYHAVADAKSDPRAIQAWKQSGKSWEDFITDAGTQMLADVVKAARAAVPHRKLVVGLYASDPKHPLQDAIFDWSKIYPGILDIAQPSLYVQGRITDVASRIRFDYEAMKARKVTPWLTAGTYGEFDPRLLEPMVLETLLNGAGGITYFQYIDFDPMDFYYHAKALAILGQFPALMKEGRPVAYKGGNNSALHYTCFASAKERLILVGNYGRSRNTNVSLPIEVKGVRTVTVVGGKTLPVRNGAVSLQVPAGGYRLVHMKNA